MFKKKLLPLLCCSVLAGAGAGAAEASPFGHWSVHGIVVNKTFRVTPLSHSLGVDGIYKLEVRDEHDKVRRQMVPRDLFLAYEIGDRFEPRGAPPTFAERARRLAAVAARERMKVEARVKRAVAAQLGRPKSKLVVTAFPQEMLPETEGF